MPLPSVMRAVEISSPGGPEVLRVTDRPVPEPLAGQIVIAVDFAGVNRPDALQRAGNYAPPPGPRTCRVWRLRAWLPRSGPV